MIFFTHNKGFGQVLGLLTMGPGAVVPSCYLFLRILYEIHVLASPTTKPGFEDGSDIRRPEHLGEGLSGLGGLSELRVLETNTTL